MRQYVLTYGIACIEIKQNHSEVITSIPDITSNEGIAKKIVNICNTEDLSPEHLADVVDDLLNA